jgi:pimeloyl-ACP methyl ester carboxylesterase
MADDPSKQARAGQTRRRGAALEEAIPRAAVDELLESGSPSEQAPTRTRSTAAGGPVLLVQGEREMSFPIGVARRLSAEVPASTLVEVPAGAHVAHFDNPSVWLGAIREFLRPR